MLVVTALLSGTVVVRCLFAPMVICCIAIQMVESGGGEVCLRGNQQFDWTIKIGGLKTCKTCISKPAAPLEADLTPPNLTPSVSFCCSLASPDVREFNLNPCDGTGRRGRMIQAPKPFGITENQITPLSPWSG